MGISLQRPRSAANGPREGGGAGKPAHSGKPDLWKIYRRGGDKGCESPGFVIRLSFMADADVIIVGGGVAGLACAVHLQAKGTNVLLMEADKAVGGRVQTDYFRDFALDRGFQVLLTAYPTCRELLDLDALHLGCFEPGARVQTGERSHVIADPFRRPSKALQSLFAPVGSLGDKLRVARLRSRLLSLEPESVWEMPNQSTRAYLEAWGFSENMIASFFRPFLSGIFLEEELATSARLFGFVYRCFSAGMAALPAGGMGAIPNQLEARLKEGTVRTATPVREVKRDRVVLEDGSLLRADAVVVATDGEQAGKWFPDLVKRPWTGGVCYYFEAPEAPVGMERMLWLNGTGQGRINHIAVPSSVAKGYTPPDKTLISVNIIGRTENAPPAREILTELEHHLGTAVKGWKFLRAYTIPRSLPRLYPEDVERVQRQRGEIEGIHLCGDFLREGSLEGAMASGLSAARRLLSQ